MSELPSIQQLKNFILYGKYGNFTTAAQAAHITQSAFSAQIKKLEENVGVQLIVRSNKGSKLTKDGEAFFLQLEPILGELEACLCDVRALGGETEPLSIGIMLSLGDVHMNRHLAYFQKHHGGASFRVYNLEARELLQKLKDDELDIISLFRLPSMDFSDYEQVFFCRDSLVYYAPHIIVPETIASASFIASQPLAQYSPQYLMNTYLDRYLTSHGAGTAKTQAWFSTPYAMMKYCQENRIGALLPRRFLQAMGVDEGWHDVEPPIILPCYLLYKKHSAKYEEIQVFIRYMRQVYPMEN